MKNLITYMILACFFVGCNKEDAWDIVKTRGAAKTEVREVPHFSGLLVANGINVVLRHGESNSATLVGWTNLLPKVKFTVDTAGVLSIRDENKFNMMRDVSNKTTVYLTYQDKIKFIDFDGDGLLTSDGTLESDDLFILIEGASGSIKLTMAATSLFLAANSRSTADVTLDGNCRSFAITSWTVAPIDARNMLVQHAHINQWGVADIFVFVEQQMNVSIEGIGDLYYKGNPEITVDRKGKGNIFQMK